MKPHCIHTVILKCVSICNLSCDYCSADCASHHFRTLDPDFVLVSFCKLLEENYISKRCKILWHGGEPTLFNAEKADKLMSEMIQCANRAGVKLAFIMQSNGFHIGDQWYKLIEKYRINMGISLDGPPEIHDLYRHTASGEGSYVNVIKNIDKLINSDNSVSLLSVIDHRHINKAELFFNWYSELKLPIKLNPYFSSDISKNEFQNYFEFLKEIFTISLNSDEDFSIEPLGSILRGILWDKTVPECNYSGNCGKGIICLDYDGQISICSRLSEEKECSLKINADMIHEQFIELSEVAAKKNQTRQELLNCNACQYFKLCHGGCSAYLNSKNAFSYCIAIKNFFRYIEEPGLILLKQRLLREKQKLQDFQKKQMLDISKNENS